MHPNNIHDATYNLEELTAVYLPLKEFVFTNKYEGQTIDFSKSKAVKALNKALLIKHYNILYWEFPDNNLCPPIPSRVDYIHYLNDLVSDKIIDIKVLDIGTGATCIYPLLGSSIYQWKFVATDINTNSIINAKKIISTNQLEDKIELRLQVDKAQILKGIINKDEHFHLSMCNPPFYKSKEDAFKANNRKSKNLKLKKSTRNFSGISNELWYQGGEKAFLHNYIFQSVLYKDQVTWFTSLVSKKELINDLKRTAKKLDVTKTKTIEMTLGNKISRIFAWTFE